MRRLVYRVFRSFSALQYRVRRRLTPVGQLVAAGLLAAIIVGPNTRLTVAYQAATFLLALLVVAALGALATPPRLELQRRLPRFATVGEPVTYPVVVRNPGARPVEGLALLENYADPRPSFEEFRDTPDPGEARRNRFDRVVGYPRWAWLVSQNLQVTIGEHALPVVPAGGQVEARVTLTPRRRGRLALTGSSLALRDPLGLMRALRVVPSPAMMLILPRRYALPPLALGGGGRRFQRGGIALASSVGDSEEFAALRDYRPGDPLKRIHWRSWARIGRPVVREYQDEFFVRHALVFDTFLSAPTPAFEEAVSVAASFACSVGTQESLLDLLFVGREAHCVTAGRGVGHVERLLEILAAVRPCRDRPFATLSRLVLEHQRQVSGAVCVLVAWDDARRELVERLRAAGVPTRVVLVTDGSVTDTPADVHRVTVGRVAEDLLRL